MIFILTSREHNQALHQEGFGSKQENNRKKAGIIKGGGSETAKAAGKGGAVKGKSSGKGSKGKSGKVKKVGGD